MILSKINIKTINTFLFFLGLMLIFSCYDKSHSSKKKQAIVPNSILKINSEKSNSSNIIIGISDPCKDSNNAFKMGKHRAMAIAALNKKFTVKYISDSYNSDNENQTEERSKKEEIMKIKTSINWDNEALKFIDSHYTQFEEGLIKIKTPDHVESNTDNVLKASIDVYHIKKQVDKQKNDKWRYEINTTLYNGGVEQIRTNYTLTQIASKEKITTSWQGNQDSICEVNFLYQSKNQTRNTLTKAQFPLDNGLQAAYMKGIINKIIMATREQTQSTDTIQKEHGKFVNLSREKYKDTLKLKINYLAINNNKLYTRLKVNNLSNK